MNLFSPLSQTYLTGTFFALVLKYPTCELERFSLLWFEFSRPGSEDGAFALATSLAISPTLLELLALCFEHLDVLAKFTELLHSFLVLFMPRSWSVDCRLVGRLHHAEIELLQLKLRLSIL